MTHDGKSPWPIQPEPPTTAAQEALTEITNDLVRVANSLREDGFLGPVAIIMANVDTLRRMRDDADRKLGDRRKQGEGGAK